MCSIEPLTCVFHVERVTGIEPALSTWEAAEVGGTSRLSREFGYPSGTAADRQELLVIAR